MDKLKEGDCEFDDPSRASTSVLYQRKIDTLKINIIIQRITSVKKAHDIADAIPCWAVNDFAFVDNRPHHFLPLLTSRNILFIYTNMGQNIILSCATRVFPGIEC